MVFLFMVILIDAVAGTCNDESVEDEHGDKEETLIAEKKGMDEVIIVSRS